eukprot:6865778-Heterocapsa_arctica.AAC.1
MAGNAMGRDWVVAADTSRYTVTVSPPLWAHHLLIPNLITSGDLNAGARVFRLALRSNERFCSPPGGELQPDVPVHWADRLPY